MAAAKQQAASLGLTGFHFGHLPTQAGIEGRYDELQNFVTRILTEGASEMERMGWVLQTVLDNYGRADQGAAGRVERTRGTR